ncbi:Uncharacterized protein ToN1_04160 [Aromatoleum petrolei]|nr:Uncharacterized protein ToN1_04160 [Aromatoleum petrolei]
MRVSAALVRAQHCHGCEFVGFLTSVRRTLDDRGRLAGGRLPPAERL